MNTSFKKYSRLCVINLLMVLIGIGIYIVAWERVDAYLIDKFLSDCSNHLIDVDLKSLGDGVFPYGGRIRDNKITGEIVIVRPGKFIYPAWKLHIEKGKLVNFSRSDD